MEVYFEAGFDREIDSSGSTPPEYANVSDGVLALHDNVLIQDLIIHDTPNNLYVRSRGGIVRRNVVVKGGWRSTVDRFNELVNLTQGGAHGHAVYVASEADGDPTLFEDNYFGTSFGYGGHFYTTSGYLRALRIQRNFFRKRFVIGGISANAPNDNQLLDNWFCGDQIYLGYLADSNDLLVDGNTFFIDNAGSIAIMNITTPTFTNNRVIATNRTLNYIPVAVPVSPDIDFNTYYTLLSPNKAAPFLINYQAVSFATWQSETGFDANSTVIDDAMPADAITVLPLGADRAFAVIENWSDAASVDVNFSGLTIDPDETYELVNLENMAQVITRSGADLITDGEVWENVDMTAWTQGKPIGWTGDWWPVDLQMFSSYLLRRVGTI